MGTQDDKLAVSNKDPGGLRRAHAVEEGVNGVQEADEESLTLVRVKREQLLILRGQGTVFSRDAMR